MQTQVVALDAYFDCMEAGLPLDDGYISKFIRAYKESARKVGSRGGVRIKVCLDSGTHVPQPSLGLAQSPEEDVLWQEIHEEMDAPPVWTRYACVGPVRGWCGHLHHARDAAESCVDRDGKGCQRQGGYSDRSIRELKGGSVAGIRRGLDFWCGR